MSPKIAILIDGDNAEIKLLEQYISEAGRFGRVTIKRMYCDFTDTNKKSWKETLNKCAVNPVQKFAYTTGKNSTDTALIIDAMDLLHSKKVNGFCIVSSDSDYTGLANRIREEGMFIMGIGKKHTPIAFQKACENFTLAEVLQPFDPKDIAENNKNCEDVSKTENQSSSVSIPLPKVEGKISLKLIGSLKDSSVNTMDLKQIDEAFQMAVDIDKGYAFLSSFSQALRKIDPTFDNRNFGYSTFRKFCEALSPTYETIIHDDMQTISLNPNHSKPNS